MPEALAEDSTVVKPRRRWGKKAKGPEPVPEPAPVEESSAPMEGVTDGGRLKRIVFHASHDYKPVEPASPSALAAAAPAMPAPRPARAPVAPAPSDRLETLHIRVTERHLRGATDPIDVIHTELDRRLAPDLADIGSRTRSRTLYATEGGAVRAYEGPGGRALTVSRREGGREEERRFSSRMVDPVVEGVQLEEETVVRETVTDLVAAEAPAPAPEQAWAPETQAEQDAPRRKRFGFLRRKPKARPAAPAERAAPASDYNPQCAAITEDGMQCRNSARDGAKYCASHKGYRPPTLEQVVAAKDTAPRVEGAPDSRPLEKGAWEPGNEYNPQCAAFTAEGLQCTNSARKGSPYCGSHKGYRAPSREALKQSLDTKPRWSKAPDTKPALKKKAKGKKGKR